PIIPFTIITPPQTAIAPVKSKRKKDPDQLRSLAREQENVPKPTAKSKPITINPIDWKSVRFRPPMRRTRLTEPVGTNLGRLPRAPERTERFFILICAVSKSRQDFSADYQIADDKSPYHSSSQ